jgi:hypothetical protein
MLEDHLKNVQDELGTTQVRAIKLNFYLKKKQHEHDYYCRDFVMHVDMKLKLKNI